MSASQNNPMIVGIDLGTTNSSIGVVRNSRPVLIPIDGSVLLPSVVGLGVEGNLMVGQAARNQYLLYPERTVRSIKRRMGENIAIPFGEQAYSPVEISAMILGQLKRAAEHYLQKPCSQAVITVPAYFSDAQRTATREAGEVAGFEVRRIFNEPTAAALCYASHEPIDRTVMVYDLGGGTFDVSIVRSSGEVTEVLASHGDTALGGDDFDQALLRFLLGQAKEDTQRKLDDDLRVMARLSRAAEEAKIRLSAESYTRVIEEHLYQDEKNIPRHLDVEINRHEYEAMIVEFIERTKDSVQTALAEAKMLARDLDDVILVGGSSRTPLVSDMLHSLLGIVPRMDVNPDQAVALGAALQAARLSGDVKSRILVDVTPFSFGTSYADWVDGFLSPHFYRPIIRRNTPLPAHQTDVFYTITPGQPEVDVNVFQGEDPDARKNTMIGNFMVEGLDLDADETSPILFDLKLNLDGILEVEVMEKHTGLKKKVVIKDAFRKLSSEEIDESRKRLEQLLTDKGGFEKAPEDALDMAEGRVNEEKPSSGAPADEFGAIGEEMAIAAEDPNAESSSNGPSDAGISVDLSPSERTLWSKAQALLEKSIRISHNLKGNDREEVEMISSELKSAMTDKDFAIIKRSSDELADVLFYLE